MTFSSKILAILRRKKNKQTRLILIIQSKLVSFCTPMGRYTWMQSVSVPISKIYSSGLISDRIKSKQPSTSLLVRKSVDSLSVLIPNDHRQYQLILQKISNKNLL